VNRVKKLLDSYRSYIEIPWRRDAAPAQRVVFCVYNENDELRLRFNIVEFEIATKHSGHKWSLFDLTNTFGEWMATQPYAKSYFKAPDKLAPLLPRYLDFIEKRFLEVIPPESLDNDTVVAITGLGSIFGFIKARELVDRLAPLVPGKLLVFFPGAHENNNYRLLNAYDGWNYLAVTITPDSYNT
jgi:hypothetical protein